MKIVFDNIIYSLQRYGGVSVVWNNLVSRILDTPHDVRFVEYQDAKMNLARRSITLPSQSITSRRSFLMPLRRYFNPRLTGHIIADTTDSISERFIFHSSYFRICNNPRAVNVTTVHDFTYELFVNSWAKRTLHCRQKHAAIRKAQCVVCISENTRRDLLRLLPDVDPHKVHVIYNGVEDQKFHVLPDSQHRDFALFVGRRDAYKNFQAILQPLALLNVPLRIVGSPLSTIELQQLQKSRIDYQYLGLVSDEELNRLYNTALFLFYPSQYEGFGLPVLEAQMAGCPVLAFNASSIPEIIGDPSLMLDEISVHAIAPLLQRFSNPITREQIVKAGIANARRFTWDRMASQYLALYCEALK